MIAFSAAVLPEQADSKSKQVCPSRSLVARLRNRVAVLMSKFCPIEFSVGTPIHFTILPRLNFRKGTSNASCVERRSSIRWAMSRSFGPITRREAVLGLLACAAGARALRAQAPTRPSVRPERLNHIAFFASDVKRTVEWYQRFFGMPVQFRPEGAVLQFGDGPEFIAIFPANGAKPGFKHMGFGVRGFARGPIDQALAAHGIKGEWSRRPAAEGDVEELMIRDPDGITIQIQDGRDTGGGGMLGDTWARPWTPAPPPQKPIIAARSINHITFGSASKERVERFYGDVFGLPMIPWANRPREPRSCSRCRREPSRVRGSRPGSARRQPLLSRRAGIRPRQTRASADGARREAAAARRPPGVLRVESRLRGQRDALRAARSPWLQRPARRRRVLRRHRTTRHRPYSRLIEVLARPRGRRSRGATTVRPSTGRCRGRNVRREPRSGGTSCRGPAADRPCAWRIANHGNLSHRAAMCRRPRC